MNRLKSGHLDPLMGKNYGKLGLVALVGLVFFVLSFVVARNPILLLLNGKETNGIVSEKKEEDGFKNGKEVIFVSSAIKYSDTNNVEHAFWLKDNLDIGTTVPLVYLPEEPEVVSKAGDRSGFGGPALPFVIGLLILTWSGWKIAGLLRRKKILNDLIARVAPVSAKVLSVPYQTHATTSNNRTRSYRTFQVIAQAEANGNAAQEFESFTYVGWPLVEPGATLNLYLDPTNPTLFYLDARDCA